MRYSETLTEIGKALSALHKDIKNPANTADNPFYKSKYAPLNDILNLVRPLLSKHGLCVFQSPGGDGEKISVTTLVLHTSGEWIESDPVIAKADKATAQGAGSAITYLRRYSLSAALGISSEDDDDGNGVEQQSKKNNSAGNKQEGNPSMITQADMAKISSLMKDKKISADIMQSLTIERYKKSKSTELTHAQALDLIKYLGDSK